MVEGWHIQIWVNASFGVQEIMSMLQTPSLCKRQMALRLTSVIDGPRIIMRGLFMANIHLRRNILKQCYIWGIKFRHLSDGLVIVAIVFELLNAALLLSFPSSDLKYIVLDISLMSLF